MLAYTECEHFYLDFIDRGIIEAHLTAYNDSEFITFDNKLIYYVDSVVSSSFCPLLQKRERILPI